MSLPRLGNNIHGRVNTGMAGINCTLAKKYRTPVRKEKRQSLNKSESIWSQPSEIEHGESGCLRVHRSRPPERCHRF